MTTATVPMILRGEEVTSSSTSPITNPYRRDVVGECYQASAEQADAALKAATTAFDVTRKMPRYQRAAILNSLADLIERDREPLAQLIAKEAGKPLFDARGEVARSILNCRGAGEEAKRIAGHEVPLDMDGDVARYQGTVTTTARESVTGVDRRLAIAKLFPLGPVLAIAPFNFPLNLTLHKVAPAIAAGNPVILKPSPQAPLTALRLGRLLLEAGMPPEAISVLPCENSVAEQMVRDARIRMVSFTGSAKVGWYLKSIAPKIRMTLELGGNGGVLIDETSDIEFAARRSARGANVYAGQYCIGVQRLIVHESRYEEFVDRLLAEVASLRVGDPLEEDTDLGPVIDDASAERIASWVEEAAGQGAQVLTGGKREGAVVTPSVITNTSRDMKVEHEEIFGPVCTVKPYRDWDQGVAMLNDSKYGLQAGIFTRDIGRALSAMPDVESGGLMVNDVPIFRVDNMPFGGVKDSGFGLEGTRYAIESMMQLKFVMLNG
ncbi:Sulfoacetaldehyde dehydrogenase [Micromonospora sp. MW-13]|uniref:aldehyde dehydrogenase family protein n=1 Tax=Micromonospora sp. MW-13 TaxID=2094022 RepID=UPI000E43FE8B|nr:Sulfoacetaldehyde dehydrogenase [Micromonospora sp. MW-13]